MSVIDAAAARLILVTINTCDDRDALNEMRDTAKGIVAAVDRRLRDLDQEDPS